MRHVNMRLGGWRASVASLATTMGVTILLFSRLAAGGSGTVSRAGDTTSHIGDHHQVGGGEAETTRTRREVERVAKQTAAAAAAVAAAVAAAEAGDTGGSGGDDDDNDQGGGLLSPVFNGAT